MENNAEGKDFLIDTNIFIWAMERSKKLSSKIRFILENPSNTIYISVATVWEIVIKQAKGRLKTPTDIEEGIRKAGFLLLPIQISHVLRIRTLPLHHKDPFDRMLVAQAQVENLIFISSDEKIWKYDFLLHKA